VISGLAIVLAITFPVALWLTLRLANRGMRRLVWWWNGCVENNPYPCPVCGYNIVETPHRCPECGEKLIWGQLPGSRDTWRGAR